MIRQLTGLRASGGKKSANRARSNCTYTTTHRVRRGRGSRDEGKGIKKEKIREWKTCTKGMGRQIKDDRETVISE